MLLYFGIRNVFVTEETSWVMGKEVLHLIIVLLLMGVGSFLVRDIIYTNPDNWSLRYLFEEIRNTFLVGILIIGFFLPLNLERLIHKFEKSAYRIKLSGKKKITNEQTQSVFVTSHIPSESFQLNTDQFLFAKADGNYVEVFTRQGSDVTKQIIRLTLKELNHQLEAYPFVFQTHRSYLINLNAIVSVSGNAQGYDLELSNYSGLIPVARSRIGKFNTLLS
ncbi:LytTR family DNA-binding domain-containing protein [Ascidiimonas aurantiaca]|uniref:LytR/AlgR family response regulator transcription factor n=1 Tax=Ascidiimonas aurantiaca TaxID=1685432 RepID=UPI0030EE841C